MKASYAKFRSVVAGSGLGRLFGCKALVGVDAGGWNLKIARVQRSERGLQFERCLSHPMAESPAASVIREAVRMGRLSGLRAAFSIADERVENHEFRLPQLEKKELETAIDWEIRKAVASQEFVFHDLLVYPGPQGVDVQCIVAAKEIVQSRYDEGKRYGLMPEYLETESSALLCCAAALSPAKTLDRLAILDLGYTSFRILFVHQGKISLTRSLYFGLGTLCQQAATQLSLRPAEMIPHLESLGTPDAAGGPARATLERLVQESLYTLCEEFRRSEFFGRDQKGLEDIEEIALCGGGACLPLTLDYLRHHLPEKRIGTLDPFRSSSIPDGIAAGAGPIWACATGLALREES